MAGPKNTVEWDYAVSDDFASMYIVNAKKGIPPRNPPVDPNAGITEKVINTKDGPVLVFDTHGRIDEEAALVDSEDLAILTNVNQHIP